MDMNAALTSFSALSQDTRLQAFRLLVNHGKQGLAAGRLSELLGIPHNTLSFHLSHLSHAGLVTSRKEGRSVIYYADLDTMQRLVRFLLKDCCAVDKTTCKGIEKLMQSCTC
jgi:ArsR family transcriptional regulator, arsenate/arsenite/antimonite-responsive transcriptional repressor